MFPIAICDDEAAVCSELRHLLALHEKAAEFMIYEFCSGEALYDSICTGLSFNLIILDIELKAMNGITVGTLLREQLKDRATEILYISGKQGYAMQLFDLRPLNFLTKPLDEEKFLRCIAKLADIEKGLPAGEFIRIHHSFLVHKLYIRRMKYEQLFLDDGTALSISQPYRQTVREQLFQMFLQKE